MPHFLDHFLSQKGKRERKKNLGFLGNEKRRRRRIDLDAEREGRKSRPQNVGRESVAPVKKIEEDSKRGEEKKSEEVENGLHMEGGFFFAQCFFSFSSAPLPVSIWRRRRP